MITRYEKNPIIKSCDLKPSTEGLHIIGVFNPGACVLNDEIILLARVAEACEQEPGWIKSPVMNLKDGRLNLELEAWKRDGSHQIDDRDPRKFTIDGNLYLTSISHLRLMRSKDGFNFTVDTKPFLSSSLFDESFGIEDPRITRLDDVFYIAYTAVSENGHGVSLRSTKDFVSTKHHGMIFHPLNKDACIFPKKIDDHYIALHRPIAKPFNKPSIWYSESPDLLHWGNHSCIITPDNNIWESNKIGIGPQPIKTNEGWLVLYHGCNIENIYSLFLCLLDFEDPRQVLKRSVEPIMKPDTDYEKNGFFPNVVFSNGWVEHPDGRILIYYGACDESICVAQTSVGELLNML